MKKILKWFKNKVKKTDKKDVIIFLIPFVVFLFYLIIFYPGALSYDSYNQLEQIRNMEFNTSHPFFHTFIEMILMRIWNTPASVALFQIIVFSVIWTNICKYNRGKTKELYLILFQVLISVFIIINPLNSVMSITLWKDILYSYMILWLAFRIEVMIDNKFKLKLKEIVLISFLLIVIYSLRYNGLTITLGVGLVLFIILIIKDKKSYNFLKFLAFIIIFFFGFKGLEKIYVVEEKMTTKSTERIMDAKLFTMASYIGRDGNVSAHDREELNSYADYNYLVTIAKYNMMDLIWMCGNVNNARIANNRKEFYTLMYKLFNENKKIAIDYFFEENAYIWRIVRYDDSYGYILKYDTFATNAEQNRYVQNNSKTFFYKLLARNVNYTITNNNKIIQTIYYSGSLYLYISIICLIILRFYNKNYFLVITPMLFNLAGLFFTMPVNDVRYYYSSFLIGYLMLIIVGRHAFGDIKK